MGDDRNEEGEEVIAAIWRNSRTNWRRLAIRLALFTVAATLFAWAFDVLTSKKPQFQAPTVETLIPEFQKHRDFTLVSSRAVAMNKGGVLPEDEAYPSVALTFRSDFPTESGRCSMNLFDCGTVTQAKVTRDRIRAKSVTDVYASGRFLILPDVGGIIWLRRHYAVE